jgi:hypothetical protein
MQKLKNMGACNTYLSFHPNAKRHIQMSGATISQMLNGLKIYLLLLLTTIKDCVQRGHAARIPVKKNIKSLERKLQRKALNRTTSEMVDNTIKDSQEQGRCSLHAKKEYIAECYKVDCEILSPFIKMYIMFPITFSKLVKTKERGASMSFMLAAKETEKVAVSTAQVQGWVGALFEAKEKKKHAPQPKVKSSKRTVVNVPETKNQASSAKQKK